MSWAAVAVIGVATLVLVAGAFLVVNDLQQTGQQPATENAALPGWMSASIPAYYYFHGETFVFYGFINQTNGTTDLYGQLNASFGAHFYFVLYPHQICAKVCYQRASYLSPDGHAMIGWWPDAPYIAALTVNPPY